MAIEIDTPKKRLEYIFGETSRGNGQPFMDALADDAEWTVVGSTAWSRTYRGKAQISSDLMAPLQRVLAPPRKTHALHMIDAIRAGRAVKINPAPCRRYLGIES
jgi:ketosteroid isomerase-like protein